MLFDFVANNFSSIQFVKFNFLYVLSFSHEAPAHIITLHPLLEVFVSFPLVFLLVVLLFVLPGICVVSEHRI